MHLWHRPSRFSNAHCIVQCTHSNSLHTVPATDAADTSKYGTSMAKARHLGIGFRTISIVNVNVAPTAARGSLSPNPISHVPIHVLRFIVIQTSIFICYATVPTGRTFFVLAMTAFDAKL